MATGTTQGPVTLEDYVRQHADADPQTLLKLLTQRDRIPVKEDGTFAPRSMEDVWRIGQMYAQSELVPDTYKGKPANCAVAIEYAGQLGIPPLFFMQQSYIVKGKPAISAALMIALLNKSKKLATALKYEQGGEGKSRWWQATAVDASTGEPVTFKVTWEMVEAEGWHEAKGSMKSKWITLPDLMGRYRAASYLIKTHYPDVLMGLAEVDEMRDAEIAAATPTRQNGSSAPVRDLAGLAAMRTTHVQQAAPASMFVQDNEPTTQDESPPAPTLAAGEIPPMDAYAADLADAATVADAGRVYDKWFGPERNTEWTPEQSQRGVTLWKARNEQIRAAGK